MHRAPERGYNIALVGCGYFGPNHMRVFNQLHGTKVTWMMDTDAQRLGAIAQQFPEVRTTTSLDDVLQDASVDAIVIATPASTHAAIAIPALRAGKHVLCEKPLARTVSECQEMIAAATLHNRVLMTGHVYLFHPAIQEMKAIVTGGSIGNPYYCSAERTNHGPIRTDVDAAWDLAAHEISIFNYLFDLAPTSVTAIGRVILKPGVHDVVALTLTYPGGLMANVLVSWLNHRKVRKLSVVGEHRLITFNDVAPRPLAIHEFHPAAPAEPPDENAGTPVKHEPLKEQARFFMQAMETGDAGRASAAHGMTVVAVLEAAQKSLERNGAPVDVELPVARAAAV
jgi:predicted dehydrogenase